MVIPDIDLNLLRKYGRQITVEDETILLRQGEQSINAYYIISGAIRLFFYTEDAEVTIEFFFENSVVSSFASFQTGSVSNYWLETIEPSELLVIPKENIAHLYREIPSLKNLYVKGLEHRLSDYIQRLQTLLSLDAREKYNELVEKRPDVVQRVKQKYIASYIGIKPESLSRIRSNRTS